MSAINIFRIASLAMAAIIGCIYFWKASRESFGFYLGYVCVILAIAIVLFTKVYV